MEFVAMDFLDPLPKSHSVKRHVLVITDRFTKLSRAIPLRDTNAATTALAFLEHWVFVYGALTYLLTNRRANFTTKFFQAVCSSLGVRNLFTTAYHPQTNGQFERFNRTLIFRLNSNTTRLNINGTGINRSTPSLMHTTCRCKNLPVPAPLI